MTNEAEAPFISYAQHGEDVVVWRALGNSVGGTYVDVGAFHPTNDSVTRALYERGWRGVNIEPQADLIGEFERERPEDTNLAIAIGDTDGTAQLARRANPGWASIVDPALTGADREDLAVSEVTLRSLATLLPELGLTEVDLLKVDVEGAEPAVVRGLLDGAIRPRVCVIEGVAPGLGRAAGDEAVALLRKAGYDHCLFDGLNHYLTLDPALCERLSVPANPLDDYVPSVLYALKEERASHLATLAKLEARLASMSVEVDSGPATPPSPLLADVDEELVRQRRRDAIARLLRNAPTRLTARRDDHHPGRRLLDLADPSVPRNSRQLVAELYERVLGRPSDEAGLDGWTAHLDAGMRVQDIARRLLESDEGRALPRTTRGELEAQLEMWSTVAALSELGHPVDLGRMLTPGIVAESLFVSALFEVALGREPTADEIELEVGKLSAGVGREWLIRAYATHPAASESQHGTMAGWRGRVARARARRTHLDTFRTRVLLAESRRIATLAQALGPTTGIGTTPMVAGRGQAR